MRAPDNLYHVQKYSQRRLRSNSEFYWMPFRLEITLSYITYETLVCLEIKPRHAIGVNRSFRRIRVRGRRGARCAVEFIAVTRLRQSGPPFHEEL